MDKVHILWMFFFISLNVFFYLMSVIIISQNLTIRSNCHNEIQINMLHSNILSVHIPTWIRNLRAKTERRPIRAQAGSDWRAHLSTAKQRDKWYVKIKYFSICWIKLILQYILVYYMCELKTSQKYKKKTKEKINYYNIVVLSLSQSD